MLARRQNVTFVGKFAGIILIPIIISSLFALVHFWMLIFKMGIQRRTNDVSRHAHVFYAAVLSLMYFLYLYETSTLLEVRGSLYIKQPLYHALCFIY